MIYTNLHKVKNREMRQFTHVVFQDPKETGNESIDAHGLSIIQTSS